VLASGLRPDSQIHFFLKNYFWDGKSMKKLIACKFLSDFPVNYKITPGFDTSLQRTYFIKKAIRLKQIAIKNITKIFITVS
jgi:hypothetical protein